MFNISNAFSDFHSGNFKLFIEEKTLDCVKSRMPVAKGILTPLGIIHASAMIWLADVTATVLALNNTTVTDKGKGFPLAININTNILSNQDSGEITAEARFIRRGQRVMVIRTKIFGTSKRLLAEITSTHIPSGKVIF